MPNAVRTQEWCEDAVRRGYRWRCLDDIYRGRWATCLKPLLCKNMRNFDSVCQLVAAGTGISILPRCIAARFSSLGLRTIELTDEWAPYNVKICVRKREDLTPSAAVLLECLLADVQPPTRCPQG